MKINKRIQDNLSVFRNGKENTVWILRFPILLKDKKTEVLQKLVGNLTQKACFFDYKGKMDFMNFMMKLIIESNCFNGCPGLIIATLLSSKTNSENERKLTKIIILFNLNILKGL